MARLVYALAALALLLAGCAAGRPEAAGQPEAVLRLGYMANLTHAQPILGLADGSLERAAGLPIKPRVFPSGPAAMTALLAGELDLLYVGPSPAVNGYIRSQGRVLRIIAGSASGGAVFVTQPGFDPAHLDGARLATPGVGSTQDIALRHLLALLGLRTREQGGRVRVTPLAPPDILTAFGRGDLDGAWVAEPWGSRIVTETGAVIAWDERELWPDGRFATTVLVAAAPYLEQHRDTVRRFVQAHVDLTRWIQLNPEAARDRLRRELARLQGKPMADNVLAAAFGRVDFVSDPPVESVREQAGRAFRLGLLGPRPPDLAGLFDLTLLQEVTP